MDERTSSTWEDELDAVRVRLSEEIKDMTPEEHVAYLHAKTESLMKRYNLKWATLRPVKPMQHERLPQ